VGIPAWKALPPRRSNTYLQLGKDLSAPLRDDEGLRRDAEVSSFSSFCWQPFTPYFIQNKSEIFCFYYNLMRKD
jgi:hypothetical protein